MLHDVKFALRIPGELVEYETTRRVDMQVSHTSLSDLRSKLRRPDMSLLNISQRDLDVDDDEDYDRLQANRPLLVCYRPSDLSPLLYNGFQG